MKHLQTHPAAASFRIDHIPWSQDMTIKKAPPSAKRDRIQHEFPALVEYTHGVLYGDLWERKGLSKRDRSLVTIAALVATGKPMQLTSHIGRGLANGVTKEEIAELITHLAFYAGWPAAMTAAQTAMDVYEDKAG
jgi:4-carboxymuconolactone decarboxylase